MSRTVVCDTYVRVFVFIGNRVLHFMSCNSNDFVAKANRSVRSRDDQLSGTNGMEIPNREKITSRLLLYYFTTRGI